MSKGNDRDKEVFYAEKFALVDITGTHFLQLRDIPKLIEKYVTGTKTLDYGCGCGRSTRFLKLLGLDVSGVDINAEMIKRAQMLDPATTFTTIKSGELSVCDEFYDFVFACMVLVEIDSRQEIVRVMKEIARILKANGIFIFLVANEESLGTDWYSASTDFEENKNLRSGSAVKVYLKLPDITIFDYFWSDADYREMVAESGLTFVQAHKPLGTDEDGYAWTNEKIKSPCTIYVVKKLQN